MCIVAGKANSDPANRDAFTKAKVSDDAHSKKSGSATIETTEIHADYNSRRKLYRLPQTQYLRVEGAVGGKPIENHSLRRYDELLSREN
jgi:hypothetical protein